MFRIGNLTSSTVIILYLKSKMMPYFTWFWHQEWGHTVAYYSCRTQRYQAPQGTFCYWNIPRSSARFQPYVWSKTSHSKYSMTVESAFLRREAAWVYLYLWRQGCRQNQSLTGPALVFFIVLVTALAVVTMFESTPHHSYYGGGLALRWVFVR